MGVSCKEYRGISGGMVVRKDSDLDAWEISPLGAGGEAEGVGMPCRADFDRALMRDGSLSVSGGAGVADAEREIWLRFCEGVRGND
jgi:hypothetical protein